MDGDDAPTLALASRSLPRALRRDAGLVVLAALAIRLVCRLVTGFDGLFGQDPFAYWQYALELRAALLAGQAPPPFSWPPGYPFLAAVATFFFGVRPLAGQAVSLAAGSLAAGLLVVLVRQLAPAARAGSLVAGLLAALAAQPVIWSLTINSDSAGLAFALVSAVAIARYAAGGGAGALALAALALGSAVLCRWVYALAALPWGAAAACFWLQTRWPLRRAAAHVALAVGLGGALLAAGLMPSVARGELSHIGDFKVYTWHPANALARTVHNTDGVQHHRLPTAMFYATPAVHPSYVFPLLAPFLALGAVTLARVRRAHAVLIAGWAASTYLLLAGSTWQSPRHSLSLFPPLSVLVALGVERALAVWPGRIARTTVVTGCALALAGAAAWTVRDVGRFTGDARRDRATLRWAEQQLPPRATLVTFGLTATARHVSTLAVVELFYETADSIERRACGAAAVFLLVDPAAIGSQWAALAPGHALAELERRGALAPLTRASGYTLYRIHCTGGDLHGSPGALQTP